MFPEDRFVELLIIGAIALIVIGPKDLPILMRRIGQFVGKMRGMAAEFRASFDELARQSELDELRREVEALRHTQEAAAPPFNAAGEPIEPASHAPFTPPMAMTPTMAPHAEPPAAIADPAPKPKAVRKTRSKPAKRPAGVSDDAS
jgi:sec-independent protein translocase protein TatB